ncbi:MAG: cytochrome c biogenesis protein CcdA [Zavarzinella sp.]
MCIRSLLLLSLGLLLPASVPAQTLSWNDNLHELKYAVEPATAKPGQTVQFKLTITLPDGLYTYPTVQPDPMEATSVLRITPPTNTKDADFLFPEIVQDPPGAKVKFVLGELRYYTGTVTWTIPVVVNPNATPGMKSISLKEFRFQYCDDSTCLSPKRFTATAPITIEAGSVPVEAKYTEFVNKLVGNAPVPPKEDPKTNVANPPDKKDESGLVPGHEISFKILNHATYEEEMAQSAQQIVRKKDDRVGTLVLIGTAMLWGWITLLTPCVFPMIPITVSVFLKKSEKQGINLYGHAAVYTLTIIAILTVAALTVLTIFSRLSVHPVTNILLGGLFVVLAMSLFGMFEITLPSFLSNFTGQREGSGGYLGTIFMAISFSIVSFTCVAPFLGGFSGMTASGDYGTLELLGAALGFAFAFASPFMLLALFPGLLKKVPKSGDWMNVLKVVMGFLELAAALKFFRTAELRLLPVPEYFTYDMVMASWVALLLVMALYLFGVFKLPHDHGDSHQISVTRMMFALFSIGFAIYLAPALFGKDEQHKNRPTGKAYAWVDSFLLPEPGLIQGNLPWSGDLKRSIDQARAKNQHILIDFTGVTCANCKLNEANVFPLGDVTALMKKYVLVQLYTDTIPQEFYDKETSQELREKNAETNLKFARDVFGSEQLPLYVILKPKSDDTIEVVGIYREGKINDIEGFKKFLADPLAK